MDPNHDISAVASSRALAASAPLAKDANPGAESKVETTRSKSAQNPIDFDREVHVATDLRERPRPVWVLRLAAPLWPQAMIGGAALVAIAALLLMRAVGVPMRVATSIVLGLVGLVGAWLLTRLAARLIGARPRTRTFSDEAHRLRVVGPARLTRGLHDVSDELFEPLVFPVWFALPARGHGWWYAAYALLAIGATAGLYVLGPWLPQWLRAGVLTFYAGLALAAMPFAFAWPTYLRVSPGRLELLRYGVLGRGGPWVRSWDVGRAGVLILAGQSAVFIGEEGKGQEALQCAMWARPALIRAVVMAARCRHQGPAPAMDALEG